MGEEIFGGKDIFVDTVVRNKKAIKEYLKK